MPTSQNDEHFLNINPETTARWAAGGTAAGLSLASLMGIMKVLQDNKEKRKRARVPSETDEDTIVLTLPKRAAALSSSEAKPAEGDARAEVKQPRILEATESAVKVRKHGPLHKLVHSDSASGQHRHGNGTYGQRMYKREKTASWQTFAASMLAAGVGGIASYKLVDTLMRNRHEKELKKELEQAQTEYMDMLRKGAGEITDAFLPAGMSKSADNAGHQFSTLDPIFGTAALGLILGTGGVAYLTKKLMDERFKDESEERKRRERMARVQRIIFRTEDGKTACDVDLATGDEMMKAALAIYLDIGEGEYRTMDQPAVKAAMANSGTTPAELVKLATGGFDTLLMKLQTDPDLRRAMRNAATDSHPILKFIPNDLRELSIPLQNKIDMQIQKGLYESLGPGSYKRRNRIDRLQALINSLDNRRNMAVPPTKLASFGQLLVASTLGDAAATALSPAPVSYSTESDLPGSTRQLPPKDEELEDMLEMVDIESKDPQAAAFVEANRDDIRKVLRHVAKQYNINRARD
jgi:hypothetical protein